MSERYRCGWCGRRIAARPSGVLYPHGPGCPGTGHRVHPGGPSSHGGADTAWFQRRGPRRIQTLVPVGGLL